MPETQSRAVNINGEREREREREREQLFVTMDNGSPPLGHLNREVQVYRGVKLLNLSFCPHTIPENCSLEENLLEQ